MSATLGTKAGKLFDDVRELFCRACGYGIVVRGDPPDCPMCRGHEWREQPAVARWN